MKPQTLETDKSVKTGKTIPVLVLRESLILVVLKLLTLQLIVGILFLLIAAVVYMTQQLVAIPNPFTFYIISLLLLLLINILTAVGIIASWKNRYYTISPEGVTKHKGILNIKQEKFDCHYVEQITMQQGPLGQMFDFGTVSLYDPVQRHRLFLVNIPDPAQACKTLETMLATQKREQPIMVPAKDFPGELNK